MTKRHAPATERNREPILAVLQQELGEGGDLLEVASGTGEHAVYFSKALPNWRWQPSDPDPGAVASIAAYRKENGPANMAAPVMLDAAASEWCVERADAVVCINMVHISPWSATAGLFAGAASILNGAGPLILYGPYFEDDVETVPSNLQFDASLRARNPDWGIRHITACDVEAARAGLSRSRRVAMPANNLMLVYR